jgi:hypothetical protein
MIKLFKKRTVHVSDNVCEKEKKWQCQAIWLLTYEIQCGLCIVFRCAIIILTVRKKLKALGSLCFDIVCVAGCECTGWFSFQALPGKVFRPALGSLGKTWSTEAESAVGVNWCEGPIIPRYSLRQPPHRP